MTVLQVCAYAAPYEGNFITSLKKLAMELSSKGHNMIYAFPENAQNKEWCKELAKQTKVYFLPLAKARIKPSTYRKLKRIYKENPEIEIIHCHFELYDIPVIMTAKKSVKVFWHLHDAIDSFTDSHNKFMYKLQYKFLHKKARLLSVSEKHREYVISLGFPEKQAKYIPNGLNLDRIEKLDNKRTCEYDFLMFGWLHYIKGVDLCLDACLKLDSNPVVAIVGTDKTESKLKEQSEDLRGIKIIPAVSDVNELYGKSKCFLHISRQEGLSYALLEAIYAGLPVICSDIRENLFASQFPTVTMVEKENSTAIAKAMSEMMRNNSVDQEKVEISRKIIEEKFSTDCWVRNILVEYEVK